MTIAPPALEDRLVDSAISAVEVLTVYLGRRLGLYEALSTPATVSDLADRSGIDTRYAREWLEQQATAGFISVDDVDARSDLRVFSLSEHHRDVLIGAECPYQVGPLADMVVGATLVIEEVADAYRTGEGVPYADYGPHFRNGQAAINRPAFTHDLVSEWIMRAVPDVAHVLEHGGRIADLGCGAGWSTIALAEGFSQADVVGYDSDPSSIADASRNAAAASAAPSFREADASTLAKDGPFDLVLILEALHDMSDPVGVLRHAREALTDDGVVLVAEEKVAESFQAPGDEMERMMYGWSVVHCLPASREETPSAALGTVVRPELITQLALSAGFRSVETPDIDAGFFRLYVLRP